MRLRTVIEHVQTFSLIIQSIEKLSKKCIMRFSETSLQIICAGESEGGVQVWSLIKVDSLFTDYRIQSNTNNEITLDVTTETLLQALKSASSSAEVLMKLAKKNDHAVLNFEIQAQSRQGKKMIITHDVRVTVMRPAEADKITEPLCPEPDVHIVLPPLSKLRTVAEHLNHISTDVRVSANGAGELLLTIQTDDIKVDTFWTNCEHPRLPNTQQAAEDSQQFHSTVVALRSLLKFLSSHVVSTTSIACICENHCLIMYVYIGEVDDAGGVLTFYIPAILDA